MQRLELWKCWKKEKKTIYNLTYNLYNLKRYVPIELNVK